MDHREAGALWDGNAEAWTRLSRAGYDVYRDVVNTPAFLSMLPDIRGLAGLDIGCGEGTNTRHLSQLGPRLTAIDISEIFIRHARDVERESPLGIDYRVASAVELPFADRSFDFATAFMSLMDIPETGQALSEAYRILAPGGFLQFSITHPCFDTPHRRNLRDRQGRTYAIEVGDYFRSLHGEIAEWIFGSAPRALREQLPKFRIPRFTKTISHWFQLLLETGFAIERVDEPRPSDSEVAQHPTVQDAQVVAYFLLVRARKPSAPRAPS